jgi:uncharacterized heparinase superfamily protein
VTAAQFARALRTARQLPRSQLAWWVLRRFQALIPVPAPHSRLAPSGPGQGAMAQALLRAGPGDARNRLVRASEVVDGRFTLLGESRRLGVPDWRRRYGTRLWNFTLQYQPFLVDLAWAARLEPHPRWTGKIEELVGTWLVDAGRGGGDAWSPYVLARRTANWIRTVLLTGEALDAGLRDRMTRSLHAQLRRLDRRLEHHLRGNHLLADLHALTLGGLFFDGVHARRWRRERMPGFWGELRAQVLPDGTHEERSPMYHAILLGDALELSDLAQAAGFGVPDADLERLRGMADALRCLSRPDGTLHLFNDCADGEAPARAGLLDRAGRPSPPHGADPVNGWALPDGGYWGVVRADGTGLIVDAGPPGPRHQPGHAHCDLLSFELDVRGVRVVVDSGVSGYGGDPLREYVRSTRAHNTLAIDGLEQSEVWGTFRTGGMAEPIAVTVGAEAGRWSFEGACRHYHDPRIVHRRQLNLEADRCTVMDRVEGAQGRSVTCWLHLHPDMHPQLVGGEWVVEGAGLTIRMAFRGTDRVSLAAGVPGPAAQGWYCPTFGSAVPAPVFELTVHDYDGRPLSTLLDWAGR